jgi:hypothetical protein
MNRYIMNGVHCAGLLDVQNILSADTGISRQTEGHSYCDHLISGQVSVTLSSVIDDSIVLCSVSCVSMSNQPASWTPVISKRQSDMDVSSTK